MPEMNQTHRERGRGRKLFWGALLIVGVLILTGALARGGRHHRRVAELPPEELFARMHQATDWALNTVDATDEQRTRIKAILDELAPDLVTFGSERQALRIRFTKAVQADQVSPDEVEEIRIASLNLAERAINRSLDLLLKVSEVFTPEQRKDLAHAWRVWQ